MNTKNQIKDRIEVKLYFNDITGREKSVSIPLTELKTALINGIKVDGSDIIGLTGICESEFILKPVSNSKRIINIGNNEVQIIYNCKVITCDGINVDEMAEELIKNALNDARILGFSGYDNSQLLDMLFPRTKPIALNAAS